MLGTAGMLVRLRRMRTCLGGFASTACCLDMADAQTEAAFGEAIEISTESPSLAVPSDATNDGGLELYIEFSKV